MWNTVIIDNEHPIHSIPHRVAYFWKEVKMYYYLLYEANIRKGFVLWETIEAQLEENDDRPFLIDELDQITTLAIIGRFGLPLMERDVIARQRIFKESHPVTDHQPVVMHGFLSQIPVHRRLHHRDGHELGLVGMVTGRFSLS